MASEESIARFPGFPYPRANYFRLPNNWTDITADMTTLGELKVVEYVLRHTWGYQEYGITKRITLDEFQNGRKHRDGTRLDRGTQLGKKAVIDGIRAAVAHGFLLEAVDDRDAGRVKKYYALHMDARDTPPQVAEDDGDQFEADTPDVRKSNPPVRLAHPHGSKIAHRTEKDTSERHLRETASTRHRRNADDGPHDYTGGRYGHLVET